MTAHIVVGYTATKAGRDAVAFASRLAAASAAELDIVIVLPSDGRSVITPPDAGYDRYLREQADTWLAEAAAGVPESVVHREHARYADSFAEGLIDIAGELGAGLIVVGAANGGSRGRHRLGSTTTQLLHSSDVPVVLVPRGARKVAPEVGISRLTVAVGTRPGAEALMAEAVTLSRATGAPLRLLSLVTVDLPPSVDTGVIRIAGAAHAEEVLAETRQALPGGVEAEAVAARGASIEEAVTHLDWQPGEVILVGSSRLAQPRRLFLGSTAAKMLHEVPVPMVVVPRTRTREGAGA
ncbi:MULTISPECIES: universal stress protein [unclassified Microbacterium]|uniref:universal stress protein n=1 Tax=unclassified Microbacterium TaxID=2609290 RepID=UPI00214AF3D1|nr:MULTISPECIES: universal stress protein [unclassified Microbacterium]MCR2783803.1 universal stress protein [Microbacterium sp. zg.B96]WIM15347.1 universal stress protein [Microbacterium sp. zg-B96]